MRLVLVLLLYSFYGYSQITVTNNGTQLWNFNTELFLNGNLVNSADSTDQVPVNGKIFNTGSISLTGDFTNLSPEPLFRADTGQIIFNGNANQRITAKNELTFPNITINKGAGELMLGQNIIVKLNLSLIKGSINLSGFNIDLGTKGSLLGETSSNRIFGTKGVIKAKRFLKSPRFTDNIAGLGIQLSGNKTLGNTVIERGHGQLDVTDGSIYRHYKINPEFPEAVDSLRLSYLDPEIGTNESRYKAFFSLDDGKSWTLKGGNVNTANNYLVVNNISSEELKNVLVTLSSNTCSKPLLVNLGPDSLFLCGSGTKLLDAGNLGVKYHWSPSAKSAKTQTVEVSGEGKYGVTVIGKNACLGSDSVIVAIRPAFAAGFKYSLAICHGDSTAFTNTTTFDRNNIYQWTFGNGTRSDKANPSILYNTPGVYTTKLVSTNRYGCKDSVSRPVNIFPLPKADFSSRDTCLGNSIIFQDRSILQKGLPFQNELVKYEWILGDGNSYVWNAETDPPEYKTPPPNYYKNPKTYLVSLVATTNGGCRDTISKAVLVAPRGKADPECVEVIRLNLGEDKFICSGRSAISLDAQNPGSTYNWYSDKGIISSSRKIEVNESGTYWVNVSKRGISRTDSVKITFSNNPVTAEFLVASLVNVGDTVQFINLSSPHSKNHTWGFGDGTKSQEEDPSHIFYTVNDYEVKLITSNGECSDTVVKAISVKELRGEPVQKDFFVRILEVSAYPNPFYSDLNLKVTLQQEADIEMVLHDLQGQLLLKETSKDKDYIKEFNFSGLRAGLYILKVRVGGEVRFVKLVKL